MPYTAIKTKEERPVLNGIKDAKWEDSTVFSKDYITLHSLECNQAVEQKQICYDDNKKI